MARRDLHLVSALDVTRGGPRRWGFWYRVAEGILLPLLRAFTRHRWVGAGHIPPTGPVIVAANHLSFAEPATLAEFVVFAGGRLPRFLIKESVFGVPVVGSILRGCKCVPVKRGSTDAVNALAAAEAMVTSGECVVIYPEGTITKEPDHWPMKPRTGAARLALTTGAVVVPVASWGAQRVWRRDGHHELRRRHLAVTMAGPPVDLSRWQGRELDAQVLEEASAAIMAAITELLVELRGEPAPAEVFDLRTHQQRAADA